jgi:hypothetical protein
MGSANELCADVWIPEFVGAPADARPRTGDGPRTVRGGAADVYPVAGLRRMAAAARRNPVRARSVHRDPPGRITATWQIATAADRRTRANARSCLPLRGQVCRATAATLAVTRVSVAADWRQVQYGEEPSGLDLHEDVSVFEVFVVLF